MAKRRKSHKRSASRAVVVRSAPRAAAPIVIRTGGGGRIARVRHAVHRGGAAVGSALLSAERTGAMIGAAVLGLLDKQGTALPTIPVLGRAGTAGLALYWLAKTNKSAQLGHAATGCLSIAVYELMREGKIAGDEGFASPV